MAAGFIIGALNFYQRHISRYLMHSCRFYPTCSEYSKQAILKHGLMLGSFISLGRLFRCHPFSGRQGLDPIK
ncbi:MAG: membrane protein insertion efficiency factor YidD [Candidatus Omnitrophota bacterium]